MATPHGLPPPKAPMDLHGPPTRHSLPGPVIGHPGTSTPANSTAISNMPMPGILPQESDAIHQFRATMHAIYKEWAEQVIMTEQRKLSRARDQMEADRWREQQEIQAKFDAREKDLIDALEQARNQLEWVKTDRVRLAQAHEMSEERLEARIKDLREEVAAVQAAKMEVEGHTTVLEEKNEKLQAEKTALEDKNAAICSLPDQLTNLRAEICEKQDGLRESRDVVKTLRTDKLRIQNDLDEAKETINSLESKVTDFETESEKLKVQRENLIAGLNEKISSLKSKLADEEAEKKELRVLHGELTADLATERSGNVALDAKLGEAIAAKSKAENDLEDFEVAARLADQQALDEHRRLKAENTELNEKYAAAMKENQELRIELADWDTWYARMPAPKLRGTPKPDPVPKSEPMDDTVNTPTMDVSPSPTTNFRKDLPSPRPRSPPRSVSGTVVDAFGPPSERQESHRSVADTVQTEASEMTTCTALLTDASPRKTGSQGNQSKDIPLSLPKSPPSAPIGDTAKTSVQTGGDSQPEIHIPLRKAKESLSISSNKPASGPSTSRAELPSFQNRAAAPAVPKPKWLSGANQSPLATRTPRTSSAQMNESNGETQTKNGAANGITMTSVSPSFHSSKNGQWYSACSAPTAGASTSWDKEGSRARSGDKRARVEDEDENTIRVEKRRVSHIPPRSRRNRRRPSLYHPGVWR